MKNKTLFLILTSLTLCAEPIAIKTAHRGLYMTSPTNAINHKSAYAKLAFKDIHKISFKDVNKDFGNIKIVSEAFKNGHYYYQVETNGKVYNVCLKSKVAKKSLKKAFHAICKINEDKDLSAILRQGYVGTKEEAVKLSDHLRSVHDNHGKSFISVSDENYKALFKKKHVEFVEKQTSGGFSGSTVEKKDQGTSIMPTSNDKDNVLEIDSNEQPMNITIGSYNERNDSNQPEINNETSIEFKDLSASCSTDPYTDTDTDHGISSQHNHSSSLSDDESKALDDNSGFNIEDTSSIINEEETSSINELEENHLLDPHNHTIVYTPSVRITVNNKAVDSKLNLEYSDSCYADENGYTPSIRTHLLSVVFNTINEESNGNPIKLSIQDWDKKGSLDTSSYVEYALDSQDPLMEFKSTKDKNKSQVIADYINKFGSPYFTSAMTYLLYDQKLKGKGYSVCYDSNDFTKEIFISK